MGSWNATCGLSNLHIEDGDKVILVILETTCNSPNPGGFCNPNDIYKPYALPIRAKYDDYGCVNNIEDGEVVHRYLARRQQDRELSIPEAMPLNLEDTIKLIAREGIKINSFYQGELAFTMFREDIYRRMVDAMGSRKFYGKDYTMRQDYEAQFDDIVRSVGIARERGEEFPINRYARTLFNEHRLPYCFIELIDDYIDGDTSIKGRMVDLMIMHYVLMLTRRAWYTSCGAGSQSREFYLHGILADYIKEELEKEADEIRENQDEDVDVNEYLSESIFSWSGILE